ncbi:peptidase S8 [bacterium]|nr:MAG: peptidase S8 [bacterium]
MLGVTILFAAALGQVPASPSGPQYVPGEVIVKYRAGATLKGGQTLAKIGAKTKERIFTRAMRQHGDREVILMSTTKDVRDAVEELQKDPSVEYAEPNYIYHHTATSNDTHYLSGILWGMYGDASNPVNAFGSQAAEAWTRGNVGSSNVYVGIIDEGQMYSHSDLAANFWTNPYDPVDGRDNDGNGYIDDVHGWDFDGNNNSTYDGSSDDHGTHVAGTIGAVGGNGTGVAGVCWNVKIISCKFLGRRGGTTANAIKAFDYLTDLKTRHGIDLVASNNSWGGGGYSQALADAITRHGNANILAVVAAGNGGSDGVGDNNDTLPSYPSNYSNGNIIAVASITKTGTRSSFSNYGATSVDIGAPGSDIASTVPGNGGSSAYAYMSGTSMATPHVTGAVALYAATHSTRGIGIKDAILSSAVPTSSLTGRCVTGGRLNVSGF